MRGMGAPIGPKEVATWLSPPIRKSLIVIGAALLTGVLLFFGISARVGSRLRGRLVAVLEQHFESEVQLNTLSVSSFPRITATGEGLVLRHKGHTDVPPLISIKKFTIEAGLFGLIRTPYHVRCVRLEGLEIQVPPRRREDRKERDTSREGKGSIPLFDIDEIIADGTLLRILSRKAGAEPHTFEIDRLTLHSVGILRPMSCRATLTNPKPPGEIQSTGEFGPWQRGEPSLTPVSGSYTFQNADLSVFQGIAGILSSEGKYNGVLERIEVQGNTDTPDFAVRISGNQVHLRTQFNAIVDGTNGDTLLQPVNAQFLRSSLVAWGRVEGAPGLKGKTVLLDVTVADARVEDLLRLAVKSKKPFMTGGVSFKTKFDLPPGEQDIADKLILNGRFGIGAAQFTNPAVQEKLGTLSHKARGEPKSEDSERVLSNLKGGFALRNGVITFSHASFEVPGALVLLDGTYGLRGEELDFRGTLRLQAKLSQTTTGIKSFLLKAVDPFFKKKGAGTVLPIKITGTAGQPSFRLNFGHASSSKQ